MAPFTQLRAWQSADHLAPVIHRVTKGFPAEERYGLTSQLRRATLSVATNLAEGQAAFGDRERLRYAGIAAASLAEVKQLLHHAHRCGYLDDATYRRIAFLRLHANRLLYGLIRSLRRRLGE